MKRRHFIFGTSALLAIQQFQILFAKEKPVIGKIKIMKIVKSEEEWKNELSAEQFIVLRKEGTERPSSSELNNEKRSGIFACAGCELPLFESKTKFDSGTGWPSFYDYIEGHVETKLDFKIIYPRTEYHCARCGGHQGHIFKDGPEPTGLRYCNNGISLKFIEKS